MNNESPNSTSGNKEAQLQLAQHTLRISDPQLSLWFYQNALGMRLLAQHEAHERGQQETHYFLGFAERRDARATGQRELLTPPCTLLELVHQPQHPLPLDASTNSRKSARYWKIGITLADVDSARERLLAAGVKVSEANNALQNLVAELAAHEVEIAQASAFDNVLKTTTATLHDPDGNAVRFIEAG